LKFEIVSFWRKSKAKTEKVIIEGWSCVGGGEENLFLGLLCPFKK
jgi:hypothetical protein